MSGVLEVHSCDYISRVNEEPGKLCNEKLQILTLGFKPTKDGGLLDLD